MEAAQELDATLGANWSFQDAPGAHFEQGMLGRHEQQPQQHPLLPYPAPVAGSGGSSVLPGGGASAPHSQLQQQQQ